ncbi:hypothetical protein GCM10009744_61150 [Kribbella alba]|uniref:Basic secretory peptidase family protein n=1 Tax=Kribbella alba TaxID=190197 RepID=A0ABP4RQ60_9ACTN
MINQRRRLFAGVAAVALVATAGFVVATRSGDSGTPRGNTAAAAEASGSLTDAQKVVRKREVNVLLVQRSNAVLHGDMKSFLAAVDPAQSTLVARQRTLFVNLRKFDFASLRYSLADERKTAALTEKYGPTTFSTRLMMRYQLTGLDASPVQTDLGYAFVKRDGRWIIVADNAIDGTLSRDGHRQPWDFKEIAVVRRGKVVVVVDKSEVALGNKIAQSSEGAIAAVRRHWPRPWSGAVMVVAVPEARVMATVWSTGTGTGTGWTVAAKAVTLYDGEPLATKTTPPVGSRIVVNPSVRKNLDQDLLVHEMTHVATVPIGYLAPVWLVEGIAEYVRCHAIEDDPHWTVDPYRKAVRTKYLPSLKVLPGQKEFDVDGDKSYGQSWWATEYVASKVGVKGMASLYTDLAVHGTSPAAYESIIRKHTGETSTQLAAAVRKFKG